VYPFDFRGHNESGGVFRADGDTELDLKAMLDYLKSQAYDKIAVIGWSIGAWTALLSASLGRPIDAIIAGAPPPHNMTSLWYIRALAKVKLLYPPLLAGIAVVRGMWVTAGRHILNTEEFSRNVPAIPILLVHNEFDYLLKEPGTAFDGLFKSLPSTTERYVLPGTGHLFDWPNTYFLWNKIIDWLDSHF
jgi:pimeloyl-ACP methyl ester carboxylesterase